MRLRVRPRWRRKEQHISDAHTEYITQRTTHVNRIGPDNKNDLSTGDDANTLLPNSVFKYDLSVSLFFSLDNLAAGLVKVIFGGVIRPGDCGLAGPMPLEEPWLWNESTEGFANAPGI